MLAIRQNLSVTIHAVCCCAPLLWWTQPSRNGRHNKLLLLEGILAQQHKNDCDTSESGLDGLPNPLYSLEGEVTRYQNTWDTISDYKCYGDFFVGLWGKWSIEIGSEGESCGRTSWNKYECKTLCLCNEMSFKRILKHLLRLNNLGSFYKYIDFLYHKMIGNGWW